jgi:hypothetical protein
LSLLCSALSAPEVAKIDGDEPLTMEEILGLRLNAAWVWCCRRAIRQTERGVEQKHSGLGRAFSFRFAHPIFWAPCVLVGDVG